MLFGVSNIFVPKDQNLGAREASAVNNAGVVELIGDDEIFFAKNGRDRARVGGKARLKDHAGFHILEARDFFFQLHVNFHGAGDGAHRA